MFAGLEGIAQFDVQRQTIHDPADLDAERTGGEVVQRQGAGALIHGALVLGQSLNAPGPGQVVARNHERGEHPAQGAKEYSD